MTAKLAALDGGTSFHHFTFADPALAPFFDWLIPLRGLSDGDLDGVETLMVTCRCNPDLLADHADVLRRFLSDGKRLVVMGETEPQSWLPEIDFTPLETNFWWWLEPGAELGLTLDAPDHPMFRHLTLADATWHYHGKFAVPPGARSLVSCREGGAILYEDRVTWPGTLILTSLDPCYHHGSFFMPAASRFLNGFLRYLTA